MNAEAESAPKRQAPLPAAERIAALDVLRGVALFGIFIMNMPGFGRSMFAAPVTELAPLDAWVHWLRDLLFAGKFNLMFGLLFGIGFQLQLDRLEGARPGGGATLVYARRLAVLLAIGLVHAALLWSGDVLLVYAAIGFLLLALRRAPDPVVLVLIGLCLVWPALSDAFRSLTLSISTQATAAFEYEDFEASNNAAFGQGSFLEAVRETTRVFAWFWGSPLGLLSLADFAVQMATGILLGFMVGRRRWVERLPELRQPLQRLQLASLAVALGCGSPVAGWSARSAARTKVARFAPALLRTIGRAALMAFYAASILRLLDRPSAARLLPPVRPGRPHAAQQLPAADGAGHFRLLRLGPRVLGPRFALEGSGAGGGPVLPRPAAAQRLVAGALPLRAGGIRLAPAHLRPARRLETRTARTRAPAAHRTAPHRRIVRPGVDHDLVELKSAASCAIFAPTWRRCRRTPSRASARLASSASLKPRARDRIRRLQRAEHAARAVDAPAIADSARWAASSSRRRRQRPDADVACGPGWRSLGRKAAGTAQRLLGALPVGEEVGEGIRQAEMRGELRAVVGAAEDPDLGRMRPERMRGDAVVAPAATVQACRSRTCSGKSSAAAWRSG